MITYGRQMRHGVLVNMILFDVNKVVQIRVKSHQKLTLIKAEIKRLLRWK